MRPSPSRAEVTVVSPLGEVRSESLTRDGVPVEGICDEVLVVDSGSSDRTREIAERLGAKIVVRNNFV